ncbi:ADP-ribosylglycohydrolase family protein [Capnocytophaga gingivalis]
MKAETKYKGSIKLSAIGDALGWITEFEKSKQSLYEKFNTDYIDSFFDWKKYVGGKFYGYLDNIKAGSYSDDTQLLLAVARSIRAKGNIDNEYFGKFELANWLYYARGGGRTVKTAAEKIQRKSVNWYNNFYSFKIKENLYDYKNSGANGAAMRVLPIALANLGNVEKIKEEIFCNSIITHGHPRAIIGAMLYGYAINHIITFQPNNFDWETYLIQIGTNFQHKFDIPFIKNRIELKEWLKEWNKTSSLKFEDLYDSIINETQNYLRLIYTSIKNNISPQKTLENLGCFSNETKGSGTSTVIAGLYIALKFSSNPTEAITQAVNMLGTDTDSIAAFTGGLIGALYGDNIIPDKWKNVQDIKYLDNIAKYLLAISEDRLDNEISYPIKDCITNNHVKEDNFKVNDYISFSPLGEGRIISIDRQKTVKKGKYNLLLNINLNIGQSIILSHLMDDNNSIFERDKTQKMNY